ncbi:MAG TPA: CoA ester lyase [Burkholderiales bacterium]|nr:CoA ester lyase [Burkholderiales bacterium]
MRSLLFVPGDDERKIMKALGSAADALILDLEDAVAPQRKAAAREICAAALRSASTTKALFVRMNALDTPDAHEDLTAVVGARPFGIVVPKCRGGADAHRVSVMLDTIEAREHVTPGATRILPIVTETAASLFALGTYADPPIPRLYGMLWGGEDLAADIGAVANRDAAGRYAPLFELARSLCLLGAAAASVLAVDAVYTDFRDSEGLQAEALEGLRSGFGAKAAIHPAQCEVINVAFTPSASDVEWAQRVVAAFEGAGGGVAAIDGKMLDRPHLRSAQRVLARARGSAASVDTA